MKNKKYDCIYISPHMDDVVFSASGNLYKNLKEYKSILIITVFTHNQNNTKLSCLNKTKNQQNNISVLKNLYDKVTCLNVRKKEDKNAMKYINIDYIHLDFPEILYRHSMNVLNMFIFSSKKILLSHDIEFFQKYTTKIINIIKNSLKNNGILYFPLGSGFHPDHLLIHDIGILLNSKYNVYFYEDIPYSFLYTNLKYRLINVSKNKEIWFDAQTNCKLVEQLLGISKTLSRPFCYLHLYSQNKLPNKLKFKFKVIEFNEQTFDKKINLISMYESQLDVCFGTSDKNKIKYLFKKYSNNIKFSKKKYFERYWKII